MTDIVILDQKGEDTETTIIFPRTVSYGGGIQETRLTFNSALITAFTAMKAGGGEKSGCNGNEFSSLVGDNSITGIKSVTVNGRELVEPAFPDIIDAILEDDDSRIGTVIVHDE